MLVGISDIWILSSAKKTKRAMAIALESCPAVMLCFNLISHCLLLLP